MRIKEAIKKADELRPNAIPEERKAAWVWELEGRLAQVRRAPPPRQDLAHRRRPGDAPAL